MYALTKSLFERIYPDLSYSEYRGWNGIRDTIGNYLEFQDSSYFNNPARSTLNRVEAVIEAEGWYTLFYVYFIFCFC